MSKFLVYFFSFSHQKYTLGFKFNTFHQYTSKIVMRKYVKSTFCHSFKTLKWMQVLLTKFVLFLVNWNFIYWKYLKTESRNCLSSVLLFSTVSIKLHLDFSCMQKEGMYSGSSGWAQYFLSFVSFDNFL